MLNGFMSRSGPNGWEVVLYSPTRSLGSLPANSELFEVLRQGADLVMSNKPSGIICGSTREFRVQTNDSGARFVRIPLVGFNWVITQNQTPGHRSPIRLTMFTDFQFKEESSEASASPEDGDFYEGD